MRPWRRPRASGGTWAYGRPGRGAPVAFGGTLHDWLTDFVEQGLTVLRLLEKRAEALSAVTKEDRKQATSLRLSVIQALSELRTGLEREARRDPELTALMPALLGFFDMMEETRAPKSKAAAPKDPLVPEPTDAVAGPGGQAVS